MMQPEIAQIFHLSEHFIPDPGMRYYALGEGFMAYKISCHTAQGHACLVGGIKPGYKQAIHSQWHDLGVMSVRAKIHESQKRVAVFINHIDMKMVKKLNEYKYYEAKLCL